MFWTVFDKGLNQSITINTQDVIAVIPPASLQGCMVFSSKGKVEMNLGWEAVAASYNENQAECSPLVTLTQTSSGIPFAVNPNFVRMISSAEDIGTIVHLGVACGCGETYPIDVKGTVEEVVAMLETPGFDGSFLN